jgi:hypothetical protein
MSAEGAPLQTFACAGPLGLNCRFFLSTEETPGLTCISHQLSTAAADPGMPTALRSVGLLDILSSMPAGPSEISIFTLGAKHHAHLHRLATKPGEKCGLISIVAPSQFFRNFPACSILPLN